MAPTTAEALRELAKALLPLAGGQQQSQPAPGEGSGEGNQKQAGKRQAGDGESSDDGEADADADSKQGDGDAKGGESAWTPLTEDFRTTHGASDLTAELPVVIQELVKRVDTPAEPPRALGAPPPLELPEEAQRHAFHCRVARAETLWPETGSYALNPDFDYDAPRQRPGVTQGITVGADFRTKMRESLDKMLPQDGTVSRLATKLARLIQSLQMRAWEFDKDDGKLDPARLSRIVTASALPMAYRIEREADFRETTVTLLLDNSGSMRGRKIMITAAIADILARVFERCDVACEVLGFSTDMRGGLHIIYKEATQPYRRIRENFGLMVGSSILAGNADGEALTWAYNRLVARPQPRKILIIISDGSPADGGGMMGAGELLTQTIEAIETRGTVELLAIGAMHDVTAYYKHAITVPDVDQIGECMIGELVTMFDPIARKRAARAAAAE